MTDTLNIIIIHIYYNIISNVKGDTTSDSARRTLVCAYHRIKIMHGYEGLNKDMFFRIKNDSITRGHSLALVKSHSRLDIRKYTFSQRVVNDWNKLPEECINATSVNMFKNKIDQYYLKTR